jgi:hypothetical protein
MNNIERLHHCAYLIMEERFTQETSKAAYFKLILSQMTASIKENAN